MQRVFVFFAVFLSISVMGFGKDIKLKDVKTGWFGPNVYFEFRQNNNITKQRFAGGAPENGTCILATSIESTGFIDGDLRIDHIECTPYLHELELLIESTELFPTRYIGLRCSFSVDQIESCGEVKVSHINEAVRKSSIPFQYFALAVED